MKIGIGVRAALALSFLYVLVPSGATAMGLGNAPPVVDSLTVSPSPVPASGTASITCAASDSDDSVAQMTVSVSGGTLPGGGTSAAVPITAAASVTGTIAWSTPGAGSYTVTCTVVDSGGLFGGPLSASSSVALTVAAPPAPPPGIDSLAASAAQAYPGDSIRISATAHGTGISYEWTANGGTIAGSGSQATWTAPAQGGTYLATLTVTDSYGQTATGSLSLSSVWAMPAYSVSGGGVVFPRRVAVDACGSVLVSDPRLGAVKVLSATGRLQRSVAVGDPSGVAVDRSGRILVADTAGRAVRIFGAGSRPVGALGSGSGEFQSPVDVAVASDGTIWVADAGAQQVKAYDPGGQLLRSFPVGTYAGGVAVDAAGGRVYVSDAVNNRVLVFGTTGSPAGVIGSYGTGAGTLVQAAGVALGADGNVYVADAYQAVVQVFSPAGSFVGIVGGYGAQPGQLDIPLGVAADPHGKLLVASTQTARVETYALKGAVLTTTAPATGACVARAAGDDGEDQRGGWGVLAGHPRPSPVGAGRRAGASSASGSGSDGSSTSALGSGGGVPSLVVSPSRSSGPGLVQLSATLRAGRACAVTWTQVGGPPVALRGAGTASPSFVARAAATYAFQGVAACGALSSAPAQVQVTIDDVPPVAQAGGTRVVRAGDGIALDGSASSDANGDAVSLGWTQTLGPPVAGIARGGRFFALARTPGLLGFQLAAVDPAGHQGRDAASVLVVDPARQAPTAVVAGGGPALAGATVTLDATASVTGGDPQPLYSWTQVAGDPVPTDGAAAGVLAFVPGRAGRWAFDVSVAANGLSSPPARVEVLASGPSGLPSAAASAPATAPAGDAIVLDGSRSAAAAGGALSYLWRQVSGPAAGLTGADQAVATAVAFEPGAYAFELTVSEGDAESQPARVQVSVAGASPLPVAVARALVAGDVTLDGRASRSGSGAALAYEWTQVGGPWVGLEDARSATPRFSPLVPGTYAFELVVVDGAVRSAPARVEATAGGSGGRP